MGHIAQTRLFVTLTLAEAAAVVRLKPDADPAAERAIAKIWNALEHATLDPKEPPPLRAREYYMAKAELPPVTRRRASPAAPPPVKPRATNSDPDDDYVPFRDEADGIYR